MARFPMLVLLTVGVLQAQGFNFEAPKQFISNLLKRENLPTEDRFPPAVPSENNWKSGPAVTKENIFAPEIPTEDKWRRVPPIPADDALRRNPQIPTENSWLVAPQIPTENSRRNAPQIPTENSWWNAPQIPTEDSDSPQFPTLDTLSVGDIACSSDGFYKVPHSCEFFIECASGVAYLHQCPKGLHFGVKNETCEAPCDAHCDKSVACKCGWDTCGNNTQTSTTDSSLQFTELNSLYPDVFSCSKDGVHLYPGACDFYIQCEGGVVYLQACPKNQNFSPRHKRCEDPCHAHCDQDMACHCGWKRCGDRPQSPTLDSSASVGFNCVRDGLFPHPETCESYVECSNGEPYVQPCPKGLHFSIKSKSCESACDAHCEKSIACECGWSSCDKLKSSDNICLLPADKGVCDSYMRRYYFDRNEGDCKPFFYSGCRGNANNFRSIKECQDKCLVSKKRTVDACRLPSVTGPCKSYVERYYFESREGVCKSFVYGGCEGNGNNFKSVEECEYNCLKRKDDDTTLPDDYKCIRDGLHRHPSTCEKYVHCANSIAYEMPCPVGLHFDAHAKRCDFPCNSHCDSSIAEACGWNENLTLPPDYKCESDGLHSHPETCEKYVKCRHGKPHEKSCRWGLHFNRISKRCEDPCAAQCDPSYAEECGWDETVTLPPKYECTRDGLYHHPVSCEKYIRCSNGVAKEMSCPQGLHFSVQHQRCKVPCDAYCEPSIGEECGWEESSSSNDVCSLEVSVGSCSDSIKRYYFDKQEDRCKVFYYTGCDGNENKFATKKECERRCIRRETALPSDYQCNRDGLFRHPRTCASFVQCSNGLHYEIACPEGLHFNSETERCESPCEAHCDRSLACRCGWPECSQWNAIFRSSPVSIQPSSSNLHRVVFPDPYVPPIYVCRKEGKSPHPQECGLYLECLYGVQEVMSCGRQLHFSPETNSCETPCDARCDPSLAEVCGWTDIPKRSTLIMPSTAHTQSSSSSVFRQVFPDPYIRPLSACHEEGRFPHPQECGSYIECLKGVQQVISCPAGLHFSPDTKECVTACEARCDPSIAEECGWTDIPRRSAIFKSSPVENQSSLSSLSRTDQHLLFTCIKDGRYPNPENCGTYFQCFNGEPILLKCSEGLHFNFDAQQCGTPCEARCDQSIACECGWGPHCKKSTQYDCSSPPDVGICKASLTRYYYDRRAGQCKRFSYGGCGGNGNNFFSMGECRQKCSPRQTAVKKVDCSIRPDIGPCFTFKQRFYYDRPDDKCKVFLYGGCGGNSNNFRSEEECRQECVKQKQAASDYKCPSSDGKFPDMYDCKKYVVCADGKARSEECPPGQAYDRYETTCRREELVSCPII